MIERQNLSTSAEDTGGRAFPQTPNLDLILQIADSPRLRITWRAIGDLARHLILGDLTLMLKTVPDTQLGRDDPILRPTRPTLPPLRLGLAVAATIGDVLLGLPIPPTYRTGVTITPKQTPSSLMRLTKRRRGRSRDNVATRISRSDHLSSVTRHDVTPQDRVAAIRRPDENSPLTMKVILPADPHLHMIESVERALPELLALSITFPHDARQRVHIITLLVVEAQQRTPTRMLPGGGTIVLGSHPLRMNKTLKQCRLTGILRQGRLGRITWIGARRGRIGRDT